MTHRSPSRILTIGSIALLCSIARFAPAQAEITDRVAALVGDEIITLSDVRWLIQYRSQTLPPDPVERRSLYSTALNQVIDETLIAREAENTPGAEILAQEIETRLDAYRQRFSSPEAFQEKLRSMGISSESLRDMIRRQLAVQKFVRVRIQPFVIVLPREIEEYYRETFLSTDWGGPAPSLELVQNQIQEIVELQKNNQELDRWMSRARQRTMVNVLLFREPPQSSNLPRGFTEPTPPQRKISGKVRSVPEEPTPPLQPLVRSRER